MHKVIVRLFLFYLLLLLNLLCFPKQKASIFFGTNDDPFCQCLLIFAESYTSEPKYRRQELVIVILRAKRLCCCQNILQISSHFHAFDQTVAGKMLSLSDLITTQLPQNPGGLLPYLPLKLL